MNTKEKTYFVSDLHLGSSAFGDPLAREKRFVQWLDSIREDAKALYLAAVIAARQNKETEVISNLKQAIDLDNALKADAKKDAEFKKLKNNSSFQNLVK
jgi:hypothetical protein